MSSSKELEHAEMGSSRQNVNLENEKLTDPSMTNSENSKDEAASSTNSNFMEELFDDINEVIKICRQDPKMAIQRARRCMLQRRYIQATTYCSNLVPFAYVEDTESIFPSLTALQTCEVFVLLAQCVEEGPSNTDIKPAFQNIEKAVCAAKFLHLAVAALYQDFAAPNLVFEGYLELKENLKKHEDTLQDFLEKGGNLLEIFDRSRYRKFADAGLKHLASDEEQTYQEGGNVPTRATDDEDDGTEKE